MANFKIGDKIIGNERNTYGITSKGTLWFVASTGTNDGWIYVSRNPLRGSHIGEFLVQASQFDLYEASPKVEQKENKTKAFVLKARVPYVVKGADCKSV